MSLYFLDSSALAKRYVTETGSDWVRAIADPAQGNTLIIARIAWVEVLGALARRQREAALAVDDVARAIRTFRYHLDTQYQVVELDAVLAMAAGDLVTRHPLRAYDAVQLASALRVQTELARSRDTALIFVSADERLTVVAQAEGLPTDDPHLHP